MSIVMPYYQDGNTVRSAVESVLSQTHGDWELIIVDDGSREDPALLRSVVDADSRIRLVRLEENSGTPSVPRNRGMDLAHGAFLAFLDADDLWHPRKLEIQLQILRDREANFCFTDVYLFREEPRPAFYRSEVSAGGVRVAKVTLQTLLRKNVIRSGSSVVVRRASLLGLRFPEDPRYRAIEDFLFWVAVHDVRVQQSCWIRAPLVAHRRSAGSISRSKWFMVRQNVRGYRELTVRGRRLGVCVFGYLLSYGLLSVWYGVRTRLGTWWVNHKWGSSAAHSAESGGREEP